MPNDPATIARHVLEYREEARRVREFASQQENASLRPVLLAYAMEMEEAALNLEQDLYSQSADRRG